MLSTERDWWWLTHQVPIGTITIADVWAGEATPATGASDVWDAWSPHHETVRAWLDAAVSA